MASVKRLENGRWRARYYDDEGKQRSKNFRRKIDADQWITTHTAALLTGDYIDPRSGTLSFRSWFDQWAKVQVWETTTLEQATVAANSVTFGSKPLKKITAADIQAWVKTMTKPSSTSPTGLAASTITTRHRFVSMAFKAAVRDRQIARNPAEGTPLPRQRRKAASMVIPTPAEVAAILDKADEYFRAYIAVCAFAGLRLGEASGLKVSDVDFLGRTINVERQVQGTSAKTIVIRRPKDHSERVVFAPSELTLMISRHLEQFGARVDEDDEWLFTNGGHHFVRASAGARFRKARDAAGLTDFTLHDMRHFYASGLIASGCDVVTVQRALGHSSPSITLDVYSHLWPSAEDTTRQAASEIMASVFKAENSDETDLRQESR